MASVKIFWDPQGFELDSLQDKKYIDATDGDTPSIAVSIRMLSIDTPEVHYPMNQKPSRQDGNLKQLADWITEGKAPIRDSLAEYIQPRLATGTAGTLQLQQGEAASAFFKALVKEKLERPRGGPRRVFVWTSDEQFDQYGRLLAYMAPKYTPDELKTMSPRDRATFNYLMIESGWGASFVIYPSLPKHSDLVLLQKAAQTAFEEKKGAWADPNALTGYEFRMCYKLFEVTQKLVAGKNVPSAERHGWIERFCADMTTREIFYPQDYFKVPAYNRIFIWADDVTEAVGRLNLAPGD
jgi:endonuclease YncB( thermonuclease family)